MQKSILMLVIVLFLSACAQQPEQSPEALPSVPTDDTSEDTASNEIPDDDSQAENIEIEISDDEVHFLMNSNDVFYPEQGYWWPNGPWRIEKFNDGWETIVPGSRCSTPCDTICDTGPLSCAQGGSASACEQGEVSYIWNRAYQVDSERICPDESNWQGNNQCAKETAAAPGRYRAVFSYSDSCSGEFGSETEVDEFMIEFTLN